MTILFVVESPGKISKISGYLGKNYKVVASVGHFRDLHAKKLSVDIDNDFEPDYVITNHKSAKNMANCMKKCDQLYVATDLDMEGEAIAQHILDYLKPKSYKRVIFNSITKDSINKAIQNAGKLNQNMADAQKARRIIDRLYGYLISPLLQKKFGAKLSAGRVQSIATRLIIDKETMIQEKIAENDGCFYYNITGDFEYDDGKTISAAMHKVSDDYSEKYRQSKTSRVKYIMGLCLKSSYRVSHVKISQSIRNPPPPFDTCALQQQATKHGFTVESCMRIAQKLYESGYITYMRTDSVDISADGHKLIKSAIGEIYGKKFYKKTIYQNKTKNAQEAHEAIRPTNPSAQILPDTVDDYQKRLYDIIWKRTMASQMKPAKIDVNNVQISISKLKSKYYFQGSQESIDFPGYLIVYGKESQSGSMSMIRSDDIIDVDNITAKQTCEMLPPRYTEASFVSELKKMGIGRPSTYSSIINTIVARNYVEKRDVEGSSHDGINYTIKKKSGKLSLSEENTKIIIGAGKNKICSTEIGRKVVGYLLSKFANMMEYSFTAEIESELDSVISGSTGWVNVVDKYHKILDKNVGRELRKMAKKTDRLLGKDKDGHNIYSSSCGKYPVVKSVGNGSVRTAKIKPPLCANSIDLDAAIQLLKYPKKVGEICGKDILMFNGKNGLFLTCDTTSVNVSSPKTADIDAGIESLKKKIESIKTVKKNGRNIPYTVCTGKFGPYIRSKNKNYPIPKCVDESKITDEEVLKILSAPKKKKFIRKK